MGAPHGTPFERVMRRTLPEPNTGCVLFEGFVNPQGYGNVKVRGVAKLTHRVTWEEVNGPIPEGAYVLHSCDTPACVNPDHLFLGNQDDNMKDAAGKGRVRKGEEHHNAKLTSDKVLKIVSLRRDKGATYKELSERFGVDYSHVWNICNGNAWNHVTQEVM